jgi:hypothetical protein
MLGLLLGIVLYMLILIFEFAFRFLHIDVVTEVGELGLPATLW